MSKAAIRDFLIGNADINNKVSNRVFPSHLPQGTPIPALVLQTINRTHEYHLTNELGISPQMIQIDVYAATRPEVEEIAELIRDRLSGYRGSLNADTFCHGARIERNTPIDTPPADASDRWLSRQSMDFQLHITSSVPTHAA